MLGNLQSNGPYLPEFNCILLSQAALLLNVYFLFSLSICRIDGQRVIASASSSSATASVRNCFVSMASKPMNIRWIRPGSLPYLNSLNSIVLDNFPRILKTGFKLIFFYFITCGNMIHKYILTSSIIVLKGSTIIA